MWRLFATGYETCVPFGARGRRSLHNIAPMSNAHDKDNQFIVLNAVDGAVITDTDPIVWCVAQHSASARTGIVSEAGDAFFYSGSLLPGKLAKLAQRRAREANIIGHRGLPDFFQVILP